MNRRSNRSAVLALTLSAIAVIGLAVLPVWTQWVPSARAAEAPVGAAGQTARLMAAAMSVDDLINLKQLHFSDAEIKDEFRHSGGAAGKLTLTAADEKRLKDAGFSDEMIAFFKSGGGEAQHVEKAVTFESIVQMFKDGKSVEDMLDAVKGAKIDFTAIVLVKLNLAKVPQAVIFALAGKPLTLDDVKRLAGLPGLPGDEMTAAAWMKLAAMVGVTKTAVTASDAITLTRAKVPNELIAMLREGAVPPNTTVTTPPPGPVEGLAKKVSYTEVAQPKKPGVYDHVGRLFNINYPSDWEVLRTIQGGQVGYIFTPQKGQTNPDKVEIGLEINVMPMMEGSNLRSTDPVSLLKQFLPIARSNEPGLAATSEVTKCKLGELDAATISFAGKLVKLPGEFIVEFTLTSDDGHLIMLASQAPKDKLADYQDAFAKIRKQSRFGQIRPPRRETSLEPQQIVRKYKESVVSVMASNDAGDGGTGTGFIISKDGYLLTNRHVIWDDEKGKPLPTITVEWDESMHKKKVPAKLVGEKFELTLFAAAQHGVDIALLKIEAAPGDYEPLPLTSLINVEAGDGVVSMGFPSRGLLEGISLTVTKGVVTRFNRGLDGRVNSVLTDAAITHGSSGGPLISLVTGGVIGLTTYQPGPHRFADQKTQDLINYFGVVPIDDCLREWPLVCQLGVPMDGSMLDFLDCYELSRLFQIKGSYGAAMTLARKAMSLKTDSADACCQLANCILLQCIGEMNSEDGLESAKKLKPKIDEATRLALEADPNNSESLIIQAQMHLQFSELAEAAKSADQAIKADPKNVQGYYVRAMVALAQKQYLTALKNVQAAKDIVKGLVPDPHLLAGRIHYANDSPEEGKAEYDRASAIQPGNLEARMGVAQYFELKKDYEAAVAEYKKVAEDFPDNPLVSAQIGHCYFQAHKTKEAIDALIDAYAIYGKMIVPPPELLLFELATALKSAKNDKYVHFFGELLQYHPFGEGALLANKELALLAINNKDLGLARAHVRWGLAIQENDDDLKATLKKLPNPGLSVNEIKRMIELGYPSAVAARIILANPLAFKITSDEQVVKLVQDDGIPAALVRVILESQRRHKDEKIDRPVDDGHTNKPPPPPPPAGPNVAGTWVTNIASGPNQMRMVVQYNPNGSYTCQAFVNGQLAGMVRGVWQIDKQVLSGQAENGQKFAYQFQIDGDTLSLNMQEFGGWVKFARQK